MVHTQVLLLVHVLLAAALAAVAGEMDATALLNGAREVDAEGGPVSSSVEAFDGLASAENSWEPSKSSDTLSAVIQLAEPFDLHRMEVTNSFNETGYPGISTKKFRLEHGSSPQGPWQKLTEVTLKKGTAPQPFTFTPVKSVRYLRVTLVENYGNEKWWSLAELSVYGRRSKPRETVDFNGTWMTRYGPMKLVQQGQRVTGCYDDGRAFIEGTVEGPALFGLYFDGDSKGAMAFVQTAEGDLSGVWGSDITGRDRSARWDGTKDKKVKLVCAPRDTVAEELKATGRVVLRGILFDTGKDVIRAESLPVLESLAKAMKEDPKRKYVIEGHTDNRGGEAFNQTLSERRAESVKKWLVTHGIGDARLATKGFGQSKPAMANDSDTGRAANRRVEVAAQ